MKKLLLLTLLSVFGLLFSNNCFALQYDYSGLVTGGILLPDYYFDSSSNSYKYNWSQSSISSRNAFSGISFIFPNDYDFASTTIYNGSAYSLNDNFSIVRDGSSCNILKGSYSNYIFDSSANYVSSSGSYSKTANIYNRGFPVDLWTGVNPCYSRFALDNGFSYSYSDFNPLQNNYRVYTYNRSYVDYPLFPSFTGLNDKISTSDGLKLSESMINHNGVTYTGTFSFSRVFKNNNMLGFGSLSIPLSSWDGYFVNSDNLYQGRELEWKFLFNFMGGVTINSGSAVELSFESPFDLYSGSLLNDFSSPCSVRLINSNVDNESQSTMEISCPISLSRSYLSFIPFLHFYSSDVDDVSFFSSWTSNDWYFSQALFITDGDSTYGGSLNSILHGNMWSLSNGTDYDVGADPDWLVSLKNLFVFGLPVSSTPLGLILGGFSNQSNCASIPTIAGMINSNETEVCPFFPASVRSITTPVLALFSVCLVFGAFMSWLGGSSGNFIEDSSSHTWGGFKIAKGGKK